MIEKKRFIYASWTILCISITTIILKFDAETYKWMVWIVSAGYLGVQTMSDIKKTIDGK